MSPIVSRILYSAARLAWSPIAAAQAVESRPRRLAIFALPLLVLLALAWPEAAGTRIAGEPRASQGSQGAAGEWETYLLLGLDQRDQEAPRSDTVILVSWNRTSGWANVVSLPRDLWVRVPGYGWNKLGSAFTLGVGSDGPGGPELMKRTLKANLGIEATHYSSVTLSGFERIVDRVGGVWVDVPTPLLDNEFPAGNNTYRRLYVPSGLQLMNGELALAYSRSRHADGDIGRSARQQQVLSAVRKRVADLGRPTRLPGLISDFRNNVSADLSLTEAVKLAPDALRLDSSRINTYTLDNDRLEIGRSSNGQSILAPQNNDWKSLRLHVRRLLTSTDHNPLKSRAADSGGSR